MKPPQPKLCVIYTGGTIAMEKGAEGAYQPPQTLDDFSRTLGPLGERYDLGVMPLMNRDSSNMIPADWEAIVQQILDTRRDPYTGYVVVHGTDTMAYSAAAVSFLLGPPPLDRPVVFTGAQRTPDADDYDGQRNLQDACAAAASELGEVAVVFGGRVLRGCRVDKVSSTRLDAFASPGGVDLGRVDDPVTLYEHAARRVAEVADKRFHAQRPMSQAIASITLTPGLSPALYASLLDPETGCQGIVLTTFGAGNVPDREGCDWVEFIRQATRQDLPVLLLGPFEGEGTDHSDYASGRAAVEAGAITVGAMSRSAAEVKFRWSLAGAGDVKDSRSVREQVRSWMDRPLCGETGGRPRADRAPG